MSDQVGNPEDRFSHDEAHIHVARAIASNAIYIKDERRRDKLFGQHILLSDPL